MKLNQAHKQSGATLMEVLVAMTISLVVTAAMIAMMSNTLGSTTRIIHMTKLSDDLRVAMQMMTRDLRRTSYNAGSMYCYGNADCATDGAITAAGEIVLQDGDSDSVFDCMTFLTDRDFDGNSTEDDAGGFRRVTDNGVGVIQMWTGGPAPDCSPDVTVGWVNVTDAEKMDITAFVIDDSLSYDELVLQDINGNEVRQVVRKLNLSLAGELVLDSTITRQLEDTISVRNDLLNLSGPIAL